MTCVLSECLTLSHNTRMCHAGTKAHITAHLRQRLALHHTELFQALSCVLSQHMGCANSSSNNQQVAQRSSVPAAQVAGKDARHTSDTQILKRLASLHNVSCAPTLNLSQSH